MRRRNKVATSFGGIGLTLVGRSMYLLVGQSVR